MHRTSPLSRRACLLLGLALLAGSQSEAGDSDRDRQHQETAARLLALVRPGDLVFRGGRSAESIAVRAASGGQRWSHVGVAILAAGETRVVHAAPAEYGNPAGVHCASWSGFVLPDDVHHVAVFRVDGATDAERDHIARTALAMTGMPFNDDYRLTAPSALYCTQLALRAISSVRPDIEAWVQPTTISLLPDPVLLPHALLQWPLLREIQPTSSP